MPIDTASEYEPTPYNGATIISDVTAEMYSMVEGYDCPACNRQIRHDELIKFIGMTCPFCYLEAVGKMLPGSRLQPRTVTVTRNRDEKSTALAARSSVTVLPTKITSPAKTMMNGWREAQTRKQRRNCTCDPFTPECTCGAITSTKDSGLQAG
jgi:hypothetical protein